MTFLQIELLNIWRWFTFHKRSTWVISDEIRFRSFYFHLYALNFFVQCSSKTTLISHPRITMIPISSVEKPRSRKLGLWVVAYDHCIFLDPCLWLTFVLYYLRIISFSLFSVCLRLSVFFCMILSTNIVFWYDTCRYLNVMRIVDRTLLA